MSEHTREWLEEAYKALTDDDTIEENKRKHERLKRIEDKKIDTGAYEQKDS